MIASLVACLAFGQSLEAPSAFEGTWELTALSVAGLPRAGEGLLVVEPVGAEGESRWTWNVIHRPKHTYLVTRRAGKPWPAITAGPTDAMLGHTQPLAGVYRLAGDTLTIALDSQRRPAGIDPGVYLPAEPFLPGPGRTIETYRRVGRAGEAPPRARPFPAGPGRVLADWDEALRGVLQGAPRGVLNGMQLRDYGDGILVVVRARSGFLDDPPAPDLAEEEVPSGTVVIPAGGRFDAKADRVVVPPPTAEQKAVIDAFRDQNPDPEYRRLHHGGAYPPNPMPPDVRLFGWDGVLASTKAEPGRVTATVVFLPRVLGKGTHGRNLLHYAPPLIETWELKEGRLRLLAGGPNLTDQGPIERPPYLPQGGVRP